MNKMKLAKALCIIKDVLPELYKYVIYFLLENKRLADENNESCCYHFIFEDGLTLTIDLGSLIEIIY